MIKKSNGPASVYFLNECHGWGVGGWASISETVDCSNSWIKTETEVHQLAHFSYNANGNIIYIIGLNDVIYSYQIISDVKQQSKQILPNEFELLQNYPNPFNPSTTINYSLPSSGRVQIKIFDILGREVTELVNEFKTAGNYNAVWNADKFSSGIYFYSITFNKRTYYKKMILLK